MQHSPEILTRLRHMLASGDYLEQSKLPPERRLAEELQSSRHELRSALAALEAEGRIWRHVGRGTFVGSVPLQHTASGEHPLGRLTNPGEVMELRLILEPRIAALAALRATTADLERMDRCLKKGSGRVDRTSFEIWDAALHTAIADATGNTLLRSVFQAVNAVRDEKLWGKLKETSLSNERQEAYTHQHNACVAAIRDRNPEEAEARMREHIMTVRVNLLGAP